MVGSIKTTVSEGDFVKRGQEFGYFAFGVYIFLGRSNLVPHSRMARRALLPEKCNKFCIGLDLWRLLGKFRPVSYMTSVDSHFG
jgi:Phosphatidylserine decarboxylase